MLPKYVLEAVRDDKVCPQCGSVEWTVTTNGKDINYDTFVVTGFKCNKCGWKGIGLIGDEEYKNKHRTELIDKILK